jgi:hypothetical protein
MSTKPSDPGLASGRYFYGKRKSNSITNFFRILKKLVNNQPICPLLGEIS